MHSENEKTGASNRGKNSTYYEVLKKWVSIAIILLFVAA